MNLSIPRDVLHESKRADALLVGRWIHGPVLCSTQVVSGWAGNITRNLRRAEMT